MKKILLTIMLSVVLVPIMKAQDLLVTTKLDTLNCKMGELKDDHYPITFYLDDEMLEGSIHKDSIFYFKKDVFWALDNNKLRKWYSLVELAFDVGGIHQFSKFRIEDDLSDKSDFATRTGFYAGTDLTVYVSRHIGYGVKYNYRSLLEHDVKYQYVGLLMAVRLIKKDKPGHLFFNASAGHGWMIQKDAPIQIMEARPRIEMSAKSLSGDITAGYRYKLSKRVSAHVKLSYNIGYPGFIRVSHIAKYALASDIPLAVEGYCDNMNTLNLTAGFSFHR